MVNPRAPTAGASVLLVSITNAEPRAAFAVCMPSLADRMPSKWNAEAGPVVDTARAIGSLAVNAYSYGEQSNFCLLLERIEWRQHRVSVDGYAETHGGKS